MMRAQALDSDISNMESQLCQSGTGANDSPLTALVPWAVNKQLTFPNS